MFWGISNVKMIIKILQLHRFQKKLNNLSPLEYRAKAAQYTHFYLYLFNQGKFI